MKIRFENFGGGRGGQATALLPRCVRTRHFPLINYTPLQAPQLIAIPPSVASMFKDTKDELGVSFGHVAVLNIFAASCQLPGFCLQEKGLGNLNE